MNPVAVAYFPGPHLAGAQTFVSNLRRYPASKLIAFSDADWDWPDLVKLKAGPEGKVETMKDATFPSGSGKHDGKPNPFAIHNIVWLTAMKIARAQGYSHMLYLEADCRVAKAGWDQVVLEEYFTLDRPAIVAGTLGVYNVSSAGREAALKGRDLIAMKPYHGVPVGVYGWTWDRGAFGAKDAAPTSVFPNGAPAVYDLEWMQRLWGYDVPGPQVAAKAAANGPFDMATGSKLWEMFGTQAYDVVGYLQTVMGAYGDVLTSEDERRELLLSGKVAISHQHKGDWAPA